MAQATSSPGVRRHSPNQRATRIDPAGHSASHGPPMRSTCSARSTPPLSVHGCARPARRAGIPHRPTGRPSPATGPARAARGRRTASTGRTASRSSACPSRPCPASAGGPTAGAGRRAGRRSTRPRRPARTRRPSARAASPARPAAGRRPARTGCSAPGPNHQNAAQASSSLSAERTRAPSGPRSVSQLVTSAASAISTAPSAGIGWWRSIMSDQSPTAPATARRPHAPANCARKPKR